MSEPNFNIDPEFDRTYIGQECYVCEREFDRSEYESDTCRTCEDRLTELVKKLKREGRL
jgi:hypothetical protein